jgi:hypothetical protein
MSKFREFVGANPQGKAGCTYDCIHYTVFTCIGRAHRWLIGGSYMIYVI